MIVFAVIAGIIALFSVLGVGTYAYSLGQKKALARNESSEPLALPSAHKPTPELPTRNERWIMEQEHALDPDRSFEHIGCRVCGPGPLKNLEVPSVYDHVFYNEIQFSGSYSWETHYQKTSSPGDADVISSEIEGYAGWHTPMIDLDIPARLIESSTPGHHHLYIDKPMTWDQYRALIVALHKCGLVEKAFKDAALANRNTQLRPPWKEKAE